MNWISGFLRSYNKDPCTCAGLKDSIQNRDLSDTNHLLIERLILEGPNRFGGMGGMEEAVCGI